MVTRVTVTLLDRHGNKAIIIFFVPATVVDPTDAIIVRIVAAINAMSNAFGVTIELSRVATYVATAGTGPYKALDKAILQVPDNEGGTHTFKIPAPKSGALVVFEADGETVRLTAAAVIAMNSAIIGGAKNESGNDMLAIRRGHRWTGKEIKG